VKKGQRFLNKDVARITGLKPQTIAYYTNKGYVLPEIDPGKGRGSNRYYSKKNIVQFLLIRELGKLGLSLKKIEQVLHQISTHFSLSSPRGNPQKNKYTRCILGIYDHYAEDKNLTADFVWMPDPSRMPKKLAPTYKKALEAFKIDMYAHKSFLCIDLTELWRRIENI
jgi:DNA-binding transcriptional MerR regulator